MTIHAPAPAAASPTPLRPVVENRSSGTAPQGVPEPERRGSRALTRLAAVLALLVTTLYLSWRVAETLDLSVWWISVPMVLLEVHALVSLGLFVLPLWDLDAVPPPAPVEHTDLALAVLVPTYNEPLEVLLPTVAAAVSVDLPHETWVLDDGDRPEVAELAAALGARYLTREVHDHAKAGNVNHALSVVDADVVAILDADHVASKDLFRHTLGYFADPLVALVQTPQDFYNVDSFEHQDRGDTRFSEQELFYRGLQPGRNRWNAAFWCGTGAVVLVDALHEVGGLAVETVTEDIHTSIRLHRRGWRTRYHNEVLARGLAAADASQYLEQRVRWGTGAMQVLRKENPAFVRGLTLPQRLSYLGTLLGWFDSWRSLGYLLAPMVVLATGAVPVRADAALFALVFGSAFLVQRWALRRLSRGLAPQGIATVFELVRMPATLHATLRLFSGRERRFTVTHKGRAGDQRTRMHVPVLLRALLVATVLSGAWFVLTLLGLTPLTYGVLWAAYGSFGWLVVNGVLLALAVRRIRREEFGAERRASVRFDVAGSAALDGRRVPLLDASLTGARVVLPLLETDAPDRGTSVALGLRFGEREVALRAVVRSARSTTLLGSVETVVVGLEFEPGQVQARALLALALFSTGARPEIFEPEAVEPVVPLTPLVRSDADLEMARALELPVSELPVAELPVAELPVAELPVADAPVGPAAVPLPEAPEARAALAALPDAPTVPLGAAPAAAPDAPVAEAPAAPVVPAQRRSRDVLADRLSAGVVEQLRERVLRSAVEQLREELATGALLDRAAERLLAEEPDR